MCVWTPPSLLRCAAGAGGCRCILCGAVAAGTSDPVLHPHRTRDMAGGEAAAGGHSPSDCPSSMPVRWLGSTSAAQRIQPRLGARPGGAGAHPPLHRPTCLALHPPAGLLSPPCTSSCTRSWRCLLLQKGRHDGVKPARAGGRPPGAPGAGGAAGRVLPAARRRSRYAGGCGGWRGRCRRSHSRSALVLWAVPPVHAARPTCCGAAAPAPAGCWSP